MPSTSLYSVYINFKPNGVVQSSFYATSKPEAEMIALRIAMAVNATTFEMTDHAESSVDGYSTAPSMLPKPDEYGNRVA